MADGEHVPLEKVHEIVVVGADDDGGVSVQDKLGITDLADEYIATPSRAIEPPMPLEGLARMTGYAPIRGACVQAIARNTVGLGHTIRVRKGHERDVAEPEQATTDVQRHLDRLAARDVRLLKPTFTELVKAVKHDEEEVGLGAIEVSRNRRGEIDGLFHVPGQRVRRLRSRDGWLLMPANDGTTSTYEYVRFYDFGEKVQYDRDGRPQPKLINSGRRWDTNELIVFNLYTSQSRDYGLPRDWTMMPEYLADKLANETNVAFFDSGGTPPKVVFVHGEEAREGERISFKVPQQAIAQIGATLKGGTETGKSRVAIIPLPAGAKVDPVDLGEVSDRDMGFVQYRADIRKRALSSFQLSPIFVADMADSSGRYDAEVQRAITLEQVFDPEQTRYEGRIHTTLLTDLGYGWAELDFNRLAVESNQAKREGAQHMGEAGVITRRDYRAAYGYPPMPEAKESDTELEWGGGTYRSEQPTPGQVPFGWNDELVVVAQPRGAENRVDHASDQRGLRPGIGGRSDRTQPPPAVEARRQQLETDVTGTLNAATQRARSRASA